MRAPHGVLFDLDGTLADTAPDLIGALNGALADAGREAVPLETGRVHVSRGARALLQLGLGVGPGDPLVERWLPVLLGYYSQVLCEGTRLYPGIVELVDRLDTRGIGWGVVTNKPRAFTAPLLDSLGLPSPPAALVCADDLPQRKPHPLPLRHACAILGALPFQCLYVGDDRRDIVAGFRAGMDTAVAAWGYIGPDEDPSTWGARLIVRDVGQLTRTLLCARTDPD